MVESNTRAERTPLEGRKPELGLHGCSRDSKLWVKTTPELCDELWAALAGMPVACGQGWLAGLTRIDEASNSGARSAKQGRFAVARTSCGLAR